MNKTHYRKVFKSDHLGTADLEDLIEEGKKLVFTIKNVKQEIGATVAGHKGNFNIAYFNEGIKPLVLNATNSKVVKSFAKGSPFVEDWNNIPVELYIDSKVKMKGEVVGGIRIKEKPPVLLSADDVKVILKKIEEAKSIKELTDLYNSDINIKTNKILVDAVLDRKKTLNP